MGNEGPGCGFIVFLAILTLLFGVARCTEYFTNLHWQKECVERGVAEYDDLTGEWKWSVEKCLALPREDKAVLEEEKPNVCEIQNKAL